jgi:feruloyl-CoA synthase
MAETDAATTVLASTPVRDAFADRLNHANADQSGGTGRVVRLALLAEPPSLDLGEITDKGSLNQRAVLRNRASVVEELYGAARNTSIVSAVPTKGPHS